MATRQIYVSIQSVLKTLYCIITSANEHQIFTPIFNGLWAQLADLREHIDLGGHLLVATLWNY